MPDDPVKRETTLVIGAGELGMAVIRALHTQRDADQGRLSVLLRPSADDAPDERGSTLRSMGIGIVRADLATITEEALAAIFSEFATVICCTGFVGGPGTQRKITGAVLKAGVDRYVPWQFGIDYDVVGRGSGQEVFDEQSDVRDMLRAQSRTHWLIISTGMFTSFLFEPSFGVVDLDRGVVHALGSWDFRLTVTTPEDIGRLTATILAHEPRIDDQVVYVAGDTFSYAELANKVETYLGRGIERVLWDTDLLRSEAAEHPDDGMRKYRLAFARDSGVAWDKDRTFNAQYGIPVTDVATWLTSRDEHLFAQAQLRPNDAAVRLARPAVLIADDKAEKALGSLASNYYGFWNNGSAALFEATVSHGYSDQTLPPGRAQGPQGLAAAAADFFAAFPDGRVRVEQQILAGDRIVSHLRVTGHFLGVRNGVQGCGQPIDYRATDIMRVADGMIVENWHVEDHETLLQQLAQDPK